MSAANETARWSERDRFCTKIARALLLLWIAGLEAPHDGPGRSGGPITLLFTRQVGLLSQGVLLRHARNILVTWTSEHRWNTAIGAMVIRT